MVRFCNTFANATVLRKLSSVQDEWTARTKWMREVGATSASWSYDGTLLSASLGPAPTPIPDGTATQRTDGTADKERREIARRTAAASGLIREPLG